MGETHTMISAAAPLPLIARVTPADAYAVTIEWQSAARTAMVETIDLAAPILGFKFYRPIRNDRALFETVHVTAGGAAIAWGTDDAVDMSAPVIERLAGGTIR